MGDANAYRELGRELRRLRETAGITQLEAKRIAEIAPQTIWRMETGQPTKSSSWQLKALCEAYGATDAQWQHVLDLMAKAWGRIPAARAYSTEKERR